MLRSPTALAIIRMPLTAHFLRHLGEPPWSVVAGGTRRRYTNATLDRLEKTAATAQASRLSVAAILPETGGHVWHLAVRAPLTARLAKLALSPSMIVSADELFLLWRLNAPVRPLDARTLSAKLAAQIGGKAMIGQPVPLPGTVLFKMVGTRLAGRFPVQMLPPIPDAYRIADGELRAVYDGSPESSPFIDAEAVEARELEWLWPGMIPLGALTLLGGAAGMGKSQTAISIAATLSSGGRRPGGAQTETGSALILEAEDDLARTVKPRLLAAGGNPRRIGLGKIIDLARGPELLEAEAKRRKDLRLVVLSPIRKFFGDAEQHGNLGVRDALLPILNWAETRRVAILGIAHPPKDKEHKEAFAGSAAYLELARAAFSVIPDPASKEVIVKRRPRLFVAAKANLAADSVTLRYRIEGVTIEGIKTSRVIWEEPEEGKG